MKNSSIEKKQAAAVCFALIMCLVFAVLAIVFAIVGDLRMSCIFGVACSVCVIGIVAVALAATSER